MADGQTGKNKDDDKTLRIIFSAGRKIGLVMGVTLVGGGVIDDFNAELIGFGILFLALMYFCSNQMKSASKAGHKKHKTKSRMNADEKKRVVHAVDLLKQSLADFFAGEKMTAKMSQFYRFSVMLQKIRLDHMKLTLVLAFEPQETDVEKLTINYHHDNPVTHADVTESVKFLRDYYFGDRIVCKHDDGATAYYDLLQGQRVVTFALRCVADKIVPGKKNLPVLFFSDMLSNFQVKIEVLHYAGSMKRAAIFCRCDLDEQVKDYGTVAACDVLALRLVSYESGQDQTAVVEADLRLLRWNGLAMSEEMETAHVVFTKKGLDDYQTYNDKEAFTCTNCGTAISLLKGPACSACGTTVDFAAYDWCIVSYNV